ncbi:MAG: hypothetical protein JW910_23415 [Anaerolineae bacterium]|nr:hypothetical protein [Anaerolineae bacterium]
MQFENSRTTISVFIWIGIGIVSFGIALYGGISGHEVGGLFVVAMFFALLSTMAVWALPFFGETQSRVASPVERQEPEKVKRGGEDRLALLLSLMDEDELAAFKEALKQRVLADVGGPDDGELPYDTQTLEALMYDDDTDQRRAN